MDGEASVCRVHHVALQTAHLDQAVKFYTELFGAELLSRRPFKRREMAWLKLGEIRLELFSVRAGERLSDWNDFLPGPVHLAFEVPDLDTFLDRVRTLGACLHPSHPEPFIPPVSGAGRIAYLLGPDGEEVEVREPD
ncbi:MAG: VOC family protein [Planctomycetaceae bacterium]